MKYLLLIGITFTVSCQTEPSVKAGMQVDSLQLPTDSNALYFPVKTRVKDSIGNLSSLDSFTNSWYSKMLFALHEPLIYPYSGKDEMYRFTWLRTFDHPAIIRIQQKGNNYFASEKISGGQGGYYPGKIIFDTIFEVNLAAWNGFTGKINNIDFWNLETENNDGGLDGSEWILEGSKDGRYHLVARWSPDENRDPNFRDCCEYLISLLKHTANIKEIY